MSCSEARVVALKQYSDARPAVQAGAAVKNTANLSSLRPVLAPEQWSNLFGENMLRSVEG